MTFKERMIRIFHIIQIWWSGLSAGKRRRIITGAICLLVGLLLGGFIGKAIGAKQTEKRWNKKLEKIEATNEKKVDTLQGSVDSLEQELEEEKNGPKLSDLPWNLTLVNTEHPMQEDYVPELTEVEPGYSVDSRIAQPLKDMLAAAEKEGLNIIICSAYRSVERQEQVFNDSVKDRLRKGMNYWEAYEDTALSVALPGTSEHGLGMAVDLISNQYTELDEKQAKTKEAKWLAENCHKFGFILRYPLDKTDETGIIFEPWHYRYVGIEDATKIMEADITLETYLQEYE